MFVKQGEVLSGNVPSIGAKLYAEELLEQLSALYGKVDNSEESWAAEPTAQRLTLFFDCVSLDGEDKMTMLEQSFVSAFNDTEKLFGGRGRLPLECYETKALVLEYFK